MKVCFPVITDQGLASTIFEHFSSAPCFLVVDSGNRTSTVLANCDPLNPETGCNPFLALANAKLDVIVTGGIGDTAVRVMNSLGFKVLEAKSTSVIENLALLERQALQERIAQDTHLEPPCGGGGQEHTCSHHH